MLAEARQQAETFPTVDVLNALMGQLSTYSVWAEVAGTKARAEGLQEIAGLADQIKCLVGAANALATKAESTLSGRKTFPWRIDAKREASLREKMIKAADDYQWHLHSGVPPRRLSVTSEAALLVRETLSLVRRQPIGQEGAAYAHAVVWMVLRWGQEFAPSLPLVPLTTPPLAYWLLTSAKPTPTAQQDAMTRAGLAMDGSTTGAQSENAVRHALCITFQEFGATSKAAHNWFRPQPDEVEKILRAEKRSRRTRP